MMATKRNVGWVGLLALVAVFGLGLSNVADATLVGWWPMNDDPAGPSGTTLTVADQINGNDGTISGLGVNSHWDGINSGHVGGVGGGGDNSLQFTAVDDAHKVTIPSSMGGVLNPNGAGAEQTISLWLQPGETGNGNRFFFQYGGVGGVGEIFMIMNNNNTQGGHFVEAKIAGGFVNTHPSFPLTWGNDGSFWEHVALTFSQANGRRLYVNGVLEASSAGGTLQQEGSDILVGETMLGGVDDLAIWDEELSAAQILAIANGAPIPEPTSLVLGGLGLSLLGLRRRSR